MLLYLRGSAELSIYTPYARILISLLDMHIIYPRLQVLTAYSGTVVILLYDWPIFLNTNAHKHTNKLVANAILCSIGKPFLGLVRL